MFPVFRFASLAIRLFSRPAIELMKKMHHNTVHEASAFSGFLIRLGNLQYRVKIKVDKRLMNIRSDEEIFTRPLKKEIALEKGIHFFYETMFYTVVIGATAFEGWKIAMYGQEDNSQKLDELKKIDEELDEMIESVNKAITEDNEKTEQIKKYAQEGYGMMEIVLSYSDLIIEREKKVDELIRKTEENQARLTNEIQKLNRNRRG